MARTCVFQLPNFPITKLPNVFQYFTGGVGAGSAGQTGSRMGTGSAQKEILDGRTVSRPVEKRPHGENLIQRQFAVENVSPGEAITLLEIERRQCLLANDFLGEIGRILSNRADNRLG